MFGAGRAVDDLAGGGLDLAVEIAEHVTDVWLSVSWLS